MTLGIEVGALTIGDAAEVAGHISVGGWLPFNSAVSRLVDQGYRLAIMEGKSICNVAFRLVVVIVINGYNVIVVFAVTV